MLNPNTRISRSTTVRAHSRLADRLALVALLLGSLALYTATLLPGVGGGDTAEFQRVGPTLGLAHVTGYPLYTLIGWLWSHLLPLGSVAWRMNGLSAIFAALALAGVYGTARLLDQRPTVALVVAAALATTRTFWQQATQAEVYALWVLIEIALVVALLLWRVDRVLLPVVGLVIGLGLAHHRMIVLLLPGVLLFVLLTRRPRWREIGFSILAMLAPLLLYAYIPLRAAPWQDRSSLLRAYLLANTAGDYLDPGRLLAEGLIRPWGVFRDLVIGQWTIVGVGFAILGTIALAKRDRAAAALLLASGALFFAFCSAYYVDDLDVFLLGAQVITALLVGSGVTALLDRLPDRVLPLAGSAVFVLPIALLIANLPAVRDRNTAAPEARARAIFAQPITDGALLIGDGWTIESLRYLQAVEGVRPDVELGFSADRAYIDASLKRDRAVYLLNPNPDLGLQQRPEGSLLRVTNEPLTVQNSITARWTDGLRLDGFTLPAGPYSPGASIPLALQWGVDQIPANAYTAFVQILDADNTVWGQADRAPSIPTNEWQPGDPHLELYAPQLAADTPPGSYRVVVGWYAWPSLQKLGRIDAPPEQTEWLVLGEIEVQQ
jgi:hypothetical protein